MMIEATLIEQIYEAAALPERWPAVLQGIADRVGAKGAVFVQQSAIGVSWLASTRLQADVADYMAAGWGADSARTAPLYAEQYPGFRSETAYRSIEELQRLPVHADFLAPRGLYGGAGTILQGANDDALQIALEGWPSHSAPDAALAWLDALRAPLGRAFSVTARLRDSRAATAIGTLDLAGTPAAIIARDGRIRAMGGRFQARLGSRLNVRLGRLRFADPLIQACFVSALVTSEGASSVRSVAVAATDGQPAYAMHLLPLRLDARDVFEADGVLLVLAETNNANVPGADLLRLLFDLTPAEARLARLLIGGDTLANAARRLAVTQGTARTHLRSVFAKTGVERQAELVRLLLGVGAPS